MPNNPEYDFSPEQADTTIGAIPLTAASGALLLNRILDNCSGARVVFDLDSTLLNNRPRNAAIMREFGVSENNPMLTNATADHFPDWSSRNSFHLLGMNESNIESLLPRYEEFWSQRFFTSEYCQYDIAVPGAVEFVSAVAENGGQVSYLTGRHEAMRAGSVKSLADLGFPKPVTHASMSVATMSRAVENGNSVDDVVELIMKPEFSELDDGYKERALENLRSGKRLIAAFDNEPAHINSYRQAFPEALCVHLLTDHSMRQIKLLDGIFSILDFDYR